jgi:cysteine-rich repeat protein
MSLGAAWRIAILCGLSAVAACSLASVTFTPLGEPPAAVEEDCSAAGDEDDNLLADCADPACADAPSCQVTPGVCGDGHADPGEECDDGNAINGDACDTNCTTPRCGNAAVDPDEQCDDGNSTNGDACDANCTAPRCGNRAVDPGEQCDDGDETRSCNGDCTTSRCGDGKRNLAAGEERDPPSSPSAAVPIDDQTCRYDFSRITQLFCAGTCGAWGGGNGCQQADADAFCKLKTGNPRSTASTFSSSGFATDAPGICCPTEDPQENGCTLLGAFADRGVLLPVMVEEISLLSSEGPGQVITDVVCTDP